MSANGYAIDDFNDLRMYVAENPGRELIFAVNRDGNVSDVPVTPARIFDECRGAEYGQLGVISRMEKSDHWVSGHPLWRQ